MDHAVAFQDLVKEDDCIVLHHAFPGPVADIASPAGGVVKVLEDDLLNIGTCGLCPVKETVEQGLRVAVAVGASGDAKNGDCHGNLRQPAVF